MDNCLACGKKFYSQEKTRGRKLFYCNDACKQKSYRDRKRSQANRNDLALRKKMMRVSQNSVEWYTPEIYIKAVYEVLGHIELDPASCAEANEKVRALRYYDMMSDGLTKRWKSRTLFLNPPYCKVGNLSNQDRWTQKLLSEYTAGHIEQAIMLVSASTDTTWFHRLFDYTICFVRGRIQFYSSDPALNGRKGAISGSAFVYLGDKPEVFSNVFSQYGRLVQPARPTLMRR